MIHWPTATNSERVAAISNLFESGVHRSAAAERLGISIHSLNGYCFRNKIRPSGRPPRRWAADSKWALMPSDQVRLAAIVAMRKAGKSINEMGRNLGVSPYSIQRLAQMHETAMPGHRPSQVPRFAVHPLPPPETWLPLDGRAASAGGGCQWPVEIDDVRQGCCGLAVHKKSYCERHYRVAYRVEE